MIIKTHYKTQFGKNEIRYKKRIFLVKKYYELKSCSLVQRAFRTNYKNESVPSHTTITNLISVFEKTGSVAFMSIKRKNPSEKRIVAQDQLNSMIQQFLIYRSEKRHQRLKFLQHSFSTFYTMICT